VTEAVLEPSNNLGIHSSAGMVNKTLTFIAIALPLKKACVSGITLTDSMQQ